MWPGIVKNPPIPLDYRPIFLLNIVENMSRLGYYDSVFHEKHNILYFPVDTLPIWAYYHRINLTNPGHPKDLNRYLNMAKMTKHMQELLNKVPVAILATATPDAVPNAVPVGAKKTIDNQTVLISNQFLNKTLANIKANPYVSLMYWEGDKGYQIKGPVTVETTGRRFEETALWIKEMSKKMGLSLRSKGAVILRVEEIYAIRPGPGAGKRLA